MKKLKILTVIGARPQIIKAAAISRAIKKVYGERMEEIILHTGQHYDANMSQVFFDELGIPEPDHNLNIGSGSHAKQTSAMITGIEDVLWKTKPDAVVLYGDTNSTLAGAIAASKIHIPVAHVEAGLRSFNKKMPEEINRITCDHVSTLLFAPTPTAIKNLEREGFARNDTKDCDIDHPKFFHCGDVMYDNSLYFSRIAEKKSKVLAEHQLQANNYILATIHRDNNTDNSERLSNILEAFNEIANKSQLDIFLPLHPRTLKKLDLMKSETAVKKIRENKRVKMVPAVSFMDIIQLEKNARMVMTDSGGLQKEAYFFKKPCIILRSETEWVEIVENGTAIVANADKEKILAAFDHFSQTENLEFPQIFGDGKAGEFICEQLIKYIR